jgi:hypothetical protein
MRTQPYRLAAPPPPDPGARLLAAVVHTAYRIHIALAVVLLIMADALSVGVFYLVRPPIPQPGESQSALVVALCFLFVADMLAPCVAESTRRKVTRAWLRLVGRRIARRHGVTSEELNECVCVL